MTMGQSLMVTVFSIIIVFLTLLIISYLIKGLQSFSQKDKAEKTINDTKPIKTEEKQEIIKKSNSDDEELVAVIAAAIAANMGVDISDVKIKSIKRVPQNTSVWSKVGREEQIFNRL